MRTSEDMPETVAERVASVSVVSAIPEPGTTAFALFEQSLPDLRLEMVGVGPQPPFMPRVRPASPRAPSPDDVRASWRRYRDTRLPSFQPWYPDVVDDASIDALSPRGVMRPPTRAERLRVAGGLSWRVERWEDLQRERQWRPSRYPAVRMLAAAARVLSAVPDRQIGELLYMGAGYSNARSVSTYYQQVPGLVSKGCADWYELGVWPWSDFESGAVPRDWWQRDEVAASLQAAHDRLALDRRVSVAQRCRSARETAAALQAALAAEPHRHAS